MASEVESKTSSGVAQDIELIRVWHLKKATNDDPKPPSNSMSLLPHNLKYNKTLQIRAPLHALSPFLLKPHNLTNQLNLKKKKKKNPFHKKKKITSILKGNFFYKKKRIIQKHFAFSMS